MQAWTRRRVLGTLGAAGLMVACRDERAQGSPPPSATGSWLTLTFPSSSELPEGQRALVYTPPNARARPVLVALHGRGEAGHGLEAGARGWRDDYHLEAMVEHLRHPPLTAGALGGMVRADRLSALNRSLEASPFEGLTVVCPYTPALSDRSQAGARPFLRFVVETLLPRVRAEVGCAAGREATAIDGVSMGGRLALWLGLSRPDVFGSVGALQPALSVEEASSFAAIAPLPGPTAPALRLVSSDGDPFLAAVRALSDALGARGAKSGLVITPGPHDYVWNRGPGAAELLLHHERVLRGLPAP